MNVLQLWGSISNPPKKLEVSYWIARLFSHFPRRDETGDAIIITDIYRMSEDQPSSLAALILAYRHFVKKATSDNPFMPPAGEIAEIIFSKHDQLARNVEKCMAVTAGNQVKTAPIALPSPRQEPANTVPWAFMHWQTLVAEGLQPAFERHLATLTPEQLRGYLIYCRDWIGMPAGLYGARDAE